jgi:hypothetical protein
MRDAFGVEKGLRLSLKPLSSSARKTKAAQEQIALDRRIEAAHMEFYRQNPKAAPKAVRRQLKAA